MFQNHPAEDTSIDAAGSRERVLREADCGLLKHYRIAHVGWIETEAPFQRVRVQPSGSYVQVCLAGEGRILLDGRWHESRPGTAALAPPRVLNAFEAVPGKRWHICWVRFLEPAGSEPMVNSTSPVMTECDPAILHSAIQGLQAECAGAADPHFVLHWVELLVGEVRRLVRPWSKNERLGRVWKQVESDLGRAWSCADLARLAHYSVEHLRRLCLSELGRTPMQQVTYMRVQHAAGKLLEGDAKLAQIALEVGYSDAFVLSKLFKRWIGCSPSEYRSRSAQKTRG